MILKNTRELEPEVMSTKEEVIAYDALTLKYLQILHNGFIETIINASPESGRFLEVGCGTGRISMGVAKYTKDITITAVDRSRTMLSAAQEIAFKERLDHRIDFKVADGRTLPFADRTFDAVYCHNMLHHIDDPMPLLLEMKRLVKEDGAFLVRDLVRKSKASALLHTWGFGLTYSPAMKDEYFASIRASFSREEFLNMKESLGLDGCRYNRQFITHHSLERVSGRKRLPPVRIDTPLLVAPLKRFYSLKPVLNR